MSDTSDTTPERADALRERKNALQRERRGAAKGKKKKRATKASTQRRALAKVVGDALATRGTARGKGWGRGHAQVKKILAAYRSALEAKSASGSDFVQVNDKAVVKAILSVFS